MSMSQLGWNIGDSPTAPVAEGAGFLSVPLQAMASPNGPTARPWGTPPTTSSAQAREKANKRALLERGSLDSLVSDVIFSKFGKLIPKEVLLKEAKPLQMVMSTADLDLLHKYMEVRTELVHRATPETDLLGFEFEDEAYGTRHSLEAKFLDLDAAAETARGLTQSILSQLESADVFKRHMAEDVWSPTSHRSFPNVTPTSSFVNGFADAKTRIGAVVNAEPDVGLAAFVPPTATPMANMAIMTAEWRETLRTSLVARVCAVSKLHTGHREWRASVDRIYAERKRAGAATQQSLLQQGMAECTQSPLLNHLTMVDQWMPIADELGAWDASKLMIALRSTAPWRTDAYEPILAYIATRFPRLHIFTLPGEFPHKSLSGGAEGHLYANKQVKLGIALVSSTLRKNVRASWGPTTKLVEAALDNGEDLDPAKNPRANKKLVNHHKRLLAKEDLGYDPNEASVLLRDADLVPTHHQKRRVKNAGWMAKESVLSDNHQLRSVDIGTVWDVSGTVKRSSPNITVELVYETTGERVVPSHRHGGLEPERWLANTMRDTGAIELPTKGSINAANSWDIPDPRNRSVYGSLAKFWPKCLTSDHDSSRFQIKVSTQFRMSPTASIVTLETKSAPFVLLATKYSMTAVVGRKRTAP